MSGEDMAVRCATPGCGHIQSDHRLEGSGQCLYWETFGEWCPCARFTEPDPPQAIRFGLVIPDTKTLRAIVGQCVVGHMTTTQQETLVACVLAQCDFIEATHSIMTDLIESTRTEHEK